MKEKPDSSLTVELFFFQRHRLQTFSRKTSLPSCYTVSRVVFVRRNLPGHLRKFEFGKEKKLKVFAVCSQFVTEASVPR